MPLGLRAEAKFEVLVGVYYFPDIAVTRGAAAKANTQILIKTRPTEMSDILNIIDRDYSRISTIPVDRWVRRGSCRPTYLQ
jgi:hypothetical protein